ncbi:MAG: hypothetical protein F6K58_04660 [Symploca sp. SIO2E9]|nr:hypothetical protein [Symploca sp. SIO2E9]
MAQSKAHDDPIIYSARGKICGIYRPSSKNFLQGTLLTDDDLEVPAQISDDLGKLLKANPHILELPLVWKCYPRTHPPLLMLVKLKLKNSNSLDLRRKGVNKFRIIGQVARIKGQSVTVLLKRNLELAEGEENSFTLTIQGRIPGRALGQFWYFTVRRQGWDWNIINANPVPNVEQPLAMGPILVEEKTAAREVKAKVATQSSIELLEGLSQAALARRLSISSSTIAKHRVRDTFSEWSRQKDPEGIAWSYDEKTKKFKPFNY